jgi:hypothetical protein
MFEFELTAVPGTLENLNPRIEKEGKEKKPAADLRLSVSQSADILAHFSPSLKAFLFNENGPRDLADGLPLRDPHMEYPLGRDEEMVGATVKLEYGVGEPMVFADAKVNQFKITPMAGGSAIVGFRVQCRPTEIQIGKLYLLQEQAVTLTVEPPEQKKLADAA